MSEKVEEFCSDLIDLLKTAKVIEGRELSQHIESKINQILEENVKNWEE